METPASRPFNIFCFWCWEKSKQMVYYIVALGSESFFSLPALCVTWNILMYWCHWLKKNLPLCVQVWNTKLLVSKYLIWQYVGLGPFLFCILDFRMALNSSSEFVHFTLFHSYIPHLVDMTYFVISVLSF